MGTGGNGLVHITLHQAQFLEALGHAAANGHVHVKVLHAGLGNAQCQVMALLDDAVDLQLTLVILARDGHRAGVVAAVELHGLGTAVTQGEPAGLERGHRRIAVHDLAMLREDGGKAHLGAVALGNAVNLAADKFLGHARLDQAHRGGVHQVAHLGGALQFDDLLGRLHRSHVDHRHAQVVAHGLGLLVGVDAQQVHDLYLGVVAVRGQEVDAAALGLGFVTDDLQLLHGSRVGHAHLGSHVGHAVHRAIPHDILDVDVVAHQDFLIVVDVNHTHQTVALLTEVVQERRILAEGIVSVIGIITRRLVVAKQQNHAVAHELLQLVASLDVSLFLKHNYIVFSFRFIS